MSDNPLFRMAADFVNNTSRDIFLTGKAGTGKTTFLKYIREHTSKRTVVVAPTGVAAINAGGVTMHSFFQLPLGPFLPVNQRIAREGFTDQYTLFKNIRISEEKRELFRDLDLLIIDEVSMVRCDMLDATDAILRYFRKAPGIPFGGVQVLYIGDLFQLPPVMPDGQWSLLRNYYASPFFFHSKVAEQNPPLYIELKKIYRQSQQSFIDILNRIRNNEVTAQDLATLNARMHAMPDANEKYVTLTTHNYKADRINADELKKLDGRMFEFRGSVEGDFPEKTLPTDATLQLKEGAQVMFIRNDNSEERRYYNGKLATVTEVNADGVKVAFSDTEEELELEKDTWENIRYSYNKETEAIDEEKLGSFTQYPIRLAWAITIHKSQGLTFRHAIIDAGESFAPGQVYVALSRCTSLDGLVLRSPIQPSSISTDALVVDFARSAAAENELETILERERQRFLNERLTSTFDLGKIEEILATHLHFLPDKKLPDVEDAVTQVRGALDRVVELQRIALKFQQQIRPLMEERAAGQLKERVEKAIGYFCKALAEEVLNPLDKHIASLKGAPKVKKYLKQVRQVRNVIARKINAIGTARYGDVEFVNGGVEVGVVPDTSARHDKPAKGSSLRETLQLLQQGLRPLQIAEQRGLALSTVEGHMSELIKSGDIDIHACMDERKVADIVAALRELPSESVTLVRQKLGGTFTYGEIRAVKNHLFLTEK